MGKIKKYSHIKSFENENWRPKTYDTCNTDKQQIG